MNFLKKNLKYILFILLIIISLTQVLWNSSTEEFGFQQGKFTDFITLFLSIIVEAFPFVILGVFISALVALLLREEWIHKFLPKNQILSNFIISFLGFLLPVCECGNVPVARRLIKKGFTVSGAVTFLFAAPIINPVTLASTAAAFSYDSSFVIIRFIGGLFVANFIGFIINLNKNQTEFLNEEIAEHLHDHHHHPWEESGITFKEVIKTIAANPKEAMNYFISVFHKEFVEVTLMLFLGAFLAALSQSIIPRDVIASIGSNPVSSVFAMALLAFVISICSNVDAFFALSYASTFTPGALLTFLIFGPMIDMKILTMLRSTFKLKFLLQLSLIVLLLSVSIGLFVNLVL